MKDFIYERPSQLCAKGYPENNSGFDGSMAPLTVFFKRFTPAFFCIAPCTRVNLPWQVFSGKCVSFHLSYGNLSNLKFARVD